jgi:glycosyltransferase involved in cell wall biosynthesis
MKISIVVQYYNRRKQFINTLDSIKQTSMSLNDIEVIVVDDASDDENSISDIHLLYPDINIVVYSFKKEDKWWSCPVIPINKGISMASGDVILLLCAECMFVGDILSDIKNRIKPNDYLVYSTLAISEEITNIIPSIPYKHLTSDLFKGDWYQHSIHNNKCYNFCTALLKQDLYRLGGFDERFAAGYDSGDLDFIWRVREIGMNIESIDYPLTYHQWHPPYLFNEFSQKDNISNLTGYSLHRYIVENESEKLKQTGLRCAIVENSFIRDDDYIPNEPELIEVEKLIDFKFNIERFEKTIIEFGCEYSNIKADLKITDLETKSPIYFKIRNNTWKDFDLVANSEICEVEISIGGKIIYSSDISLNKSISLSIEKKIKILSHF